MHFAVLISELDQGFLAGFLEGEASFGIQEQNAGQSYSCALTLRVRDDDQDLVEWLAAITGLGRLRRIPARSTSCPQIAWLIDSQDDCVELSRLLSRCGFHGRRVAELEIWSEAVRTWVNDCGDERRAALRALRSRLHTARKFGAGSARSVPLSESKWVRLGYISGLVAAEGSFHFCNHRPRFSMHLRQDDRPLLSLLSRTTGLGRLYDHSPLPPLNPSSAWILTARAELAALLELLRDADLPGQKRIQMESWAIAIAELQGAHSVRQTARREVLALAADQLRADRAYRSSSRELLRLPRRDVRAESLAALEAWGAETDGPLTCTGFSRWRGEHAEAPARNTVVRTFGTWYAAMEAAGLAERAARTGTRRYGGEAARRRRRQEQRGRVVAAVREFQAQHGRLPRAMEFFRWRFVGAPDSPTQATVYNLFPGGWAEVLEACRAGYGLG